ncbi:MAG TPA: BCD family MFS transporter [Woeseiaceae bacterium]|nr:BCD family MFS transporter [Woeseiaceae bacterium]
MKPLGWFGIFRIGLVQTALGSIVVLTTSTLNRVMVVELGLAAMLPGALVALHYAVQVSRPRLGYGSDLGGRRTPWIIGGMAVLGVGGIAASCATAWMATDPVAGAALAALAFLLIGVGVGAAGTSLLVLLAKRVTPERRAPAATTVWLMMIAGFAVTAGVAGHFLDPFSMPRLVTVTSVVCGAAFLLTLVAIRNLEGSGSSASAAAAADAADAAAVDEEPGPPFRHALAEVWSESRARRFSIFVFVSMLAYSGQELIVEPFAGTVFGLTPGQSTQLAGVQNTGMLVGMILVAVGARRFGTLRGWTIGGCIASAIALVTLAAGGFFADEWPLRASVFALGMANGAFAVAAIGSMMALVAAGRERREGVRMGLWGAAQAVAFGAGGFLGTMGVDVMRSLVSLPATAYGAVFASQAVMFLVATVLAARVGHTEAHGTETPQAGPVRLATETGRQ